MGKPDRKSDAIDELQRDLDARYRLGREILDCIEKARVAYEKDRTGTNLPKCSREHLDHVANDLRQYVADVEKVRNQLPRLLSNEEEHFD